MGAHRAGHELSQGDKQNRDQRIVGIIAKPLSARAYNHKHTQKPDTDGNHAPPPQQFA